MKGSFTAGSEPIQRNREGEPSCPSADLVMPQEIGIIYMRMSTKKAGRQ